MNKNNEIKTYYFPDSILKDRLYYGFTIYECVGLLMFCMGLMFAMIFINWRLFILYLVPIFYMILNRKWAYGESLWLSWKVRHKYSKEPKGMHFCPGGNIEKEE